MVGFKRFLALFVIVLAMFGLLLNHSIPYSQATELPPEARQGKQVFQSKNCVQCHTVFGNGGYFGGDLTKVYGKYGPTVLRDFFFHPPVLTGAKKKRHLQLDEKETDAIVTYLKYLDAVNTLEWPPRPQRSK